MGRAAYISADGVYRYWLQRRWATAGGVCNFIMFNPSTADAKVDDPTIRRCVSFARRWGYGELVVTNLYAFRSTDPKVLLAATVDKIGSDNDQVILTTAWAAKRVICAWGILGGARGEAVRRDLMDELIHLYALRILATGEPAHPLYLPSDLDPVRYDVTIPTPQGGHP